MGGGRKAEWAVLARPGWAGSGRANELPRVVEELPEVVGDASEIELLGERSKVAEGSPPLFLIGPILVVRSWTRSGSGLVWLTVSGFWRLIRLGLAMRRTGAFAFGLPFDLLAEGSLARRVAAQVWPARIPERRVIRIASHSGRRVGSEVWARLLCVSGRGLWPRRPQ